MKKKVLFLTAILTTGIGAWAAELPLSDEYARAKAQEVLSKLTLNDKVSILGGCATMYLRAIPEAGLYREWAMSDCSHTMKPEHSRADWPYVHGIDDKSTALAPLSAVGCTWRTWRTNRATPSHSSSFWICWPTAPGVTKSSAAAREKLPVRIVASKATSAFRGGYGFMA